MVFDGVTRYQWLVFFIAWLGWVFDAMDATIYAIVLHPALHDLLLASGSPTAAEHIGWYGAIIFSLFLIGWAIGGISFGMPPTIRTDQDADGDNYDLRGLHREPRRVPGWWQLAAYRFLTALGIGGEWAAGAAIVAETWPEDKRAKAAGILHIGLGGRFFPGSHVQFCCCTIFTGWRALFLVGVLPAFVALLVRWWVKEPDRWVRAHGKKRPLLPRPAWCISPSYFVGDLRRGTLVGSILAFVARFWFVGRNQLGADPGPRECPIYKDSVVTSAKNKKHVSYAIMALNAGALCGRSRHLDLWRIASADGPCSD